MAIGNPKHNATLKWKGKETFNLVVTELGHGMNFISSESEARAKKSFYPKVRTSGEWYVVCQFYSYKKLNQDGETYTTLSGYEAYREFIDWMALYMSAITEPAYSSPSALELDVPSQNFKKSGFPKFAVDYGDSFGKFIYTCRVALSSASDPINPYLEASKYVAPKNDVQAKYFYPAGTQSGTIVYDPTVPYYPWDWGIGPQ